MSECYWFPWSGHIHLRLLSVSSETEEYTLQATRAWKTLGFVPLLLFPLACISSLLYDHRESPGSCKLSCSVYSLMLIWFIIYTSSFPQSFMADEGGKEDVSNMYKLRTLLDQYYHACESWEGLLNPDLWVLPPPQDLIQQVCLGPKEPHF